MSSHVRHASEFPFKKRVLLILADLLGPSIIRLIGSWCRYRIEGYEHFRNVPQDRGVILALWHGRMLIPVYHLRNRGIVSLVSRSWDGELIARIVESLGYVARRGSPRDGGREGFKDMLRDLKNGKVVSIFPDGPTGPRHNVQDGVVHLARMTGAPVVPFSYSAERNWRINSWDRYMVPKPFSRGVIVFGEAFTIPREMTTQELETYRLKIRDALTAVERRADSFMGVDEAGGDN